MACVCAHSVSISIGICQGYSAILIPQLMACEHFQINANQGSWLGKYLNKKIPPTSIKKKQIKQKHKRKTRHSIFFFLLILTTLILKTRPDASSTFCLITKKSNEFTLLIREFRSRRWDVIFN